jgi:hypothetical protein
VDAFEIFNKSQARRQAIMVVRSKAVNILDDIEYAILDSVIKRFESAILG